MGILILAVVVALILGLIVGVVLYESSGSAGVGTFVGLIVAVLIFGVWAGISSFTVVNPGEVGIVTRFGEIQEDNVFYPGPNWKSPFIEKVNIFSTQYKTYQTTEHVETSEATYVDFPTQTNTSDGQIVSLEFNVLFQVDGARAMAILSEFGSYENMVNTLIKPEIRAKSRNAARAFTADDLQQKETILEMSAIVSAELQESLSVHGVIIDSFDMREVNFDPDYIQAIELQQIAEEQVQTAAFEADEAEQRAEIARQQARGIADSNVIRAEGEAQAIVVLAEAEAHALELKGKALQEYPEALQMTFVENLDSVSWGILPGDALPIVNLPTLGQ